MLLADPLWCTPFWPLVARKGSPETIMEIVFFFMAGLFFFSAGGWFLYDGVYIFFSLQRGMTLVPWWDPTLICMYERGYLIDCCWVILPFLFCWSGTLGRHINWCFEIYLLCTLKPTASSPLKIDGCKTFSFPFGGKTFFHWQIDRFRISLQFQATRPLFFVRFFHSDFWEKKFVTVFVLYSMTVCS